jgi:hypothetical protein
LATRVLRNAFFSVNAVTLSTHVAQIAINTSKDTPGDTAMGDSSQSFLADGLRDATLDVTFNSDDASGAVSATLWTIYTGAAAVAFEIRPDAAAVSTTNPKYTGNCILTSDVPVGGAVGETQTTTVNFQVTGDVTRATA